LHSTIGRHMVKIKSSALTWLIRSKRYAVPVPLLTPVVCQNETNIMRLGTLGCHQYT
jgi:hypothetical protein